MVYIGYIFTEFKSLSLQADMDNVQILGTCWLQKATKQGSKCYFKLLDWIK